MKKGFLTSAPEPRSSKPTPTTAPPLPSVFTDAELSLYDGSDPKQPLLLALKGCVLDVSSGRDYYGPGASYNIFAGKDARRPPPRARCRDYAADARAARGDRQQLARRTRALSPSLTRAVLACSLAARASR
mmetsp:Transcript_28990/g.71178  ORF Transcript_28990/g.71178 Transcript_28990/m.71178 type:complete len:131 (+) Transcript_28990:135-527(+)